MDYSKANKEAWEEACHAIRPQLIGQDQDYIRGLFTRGHSSRQSTSGTPSSRRR